MTMQKDAWDFFDACETGKGWGVCKAWCAPDAGFSAQADALAEVKTIESYAEWMKGLLGPIPDGHYEVKSFAADEKRGNVVVAAVFHGTHTAPMGDLAPTGKKIAADYAYVLDFDGGKITHMTKIWNDAHSLKQLGWG